MPIRITVIICTCNRPDTLGRTLNSLVRQNFSHDHYEVLVIDNRPSTETRVVVTNQAAEGVRIRYATALDEGVSWARNRGVSLANGDIIAFIDDDAVARQNWLSIIDDKFSNSPEVDALSGPVVTLLPLALPRWFPRRLISHISLSDYRRTPGPMRYPYYGFGVNMAVRVSAIQRVGNFDTDFGRTGANCYRNGEETDFFLRLERSGGSILFHPDLIVHHDIQGERITRQRLYRQTFWIGEASARIERKWMPPIYTGLRAGLAPLCILGGALVWFGATVIPWCWKLSVFAQCIVYNRIGYLYGLVNAKTIEKNVVQQWY